MAETLLIPLYVRAIESKRPDALLRDEKAVELLSRRESAFSSIKRIKMDDQDRATLVLRNREFDRRVTEFLARSPEAVVVHIGCGLDARFERVDNGRVEWYDLDLPEVIELRRKLIGGEGPRYHQLSCSVFDEAWLHVMSVHRMRSFLFLAEGVFMYFEEAQVRSLVLTLRKHFPGSELVFDAFSPFLVRANNLRLRLSRSGIGARYCWGLKRGQELEAWGDGIRLLDEWFPLDHPEPRLARVRWVRHIPLLARVMGIFHYRLGTKGAASRPICWARPPRPVATGRSVTALRSGIRGAQELHPRSAAGHRLGAYLFSGFASVHVESRTLGALPGEPGLASNVLLAEA